MKIQKQYNLLRNFGLVCMLFGIFITLFLLIKKQYILCIIFIIFLFAVLAIAGKYISGIYLQLLMLKRIKQKGGEIPYADLLQDYKEKLENKKIENVEELFSQIIDRLVNNKLILLDKNIIKQIK